MWIFHLDLLCGKPPAYYSTSQVDEKVTFRVDFKSIYINYAVETLQICCGFSSLTFILTGKNKVHNISAIKYINADFTVYYPQIHSGF